jgi:hypothetical protein
MASGAALCAVLRAPAQEREPIPSDAKQAEARRLVREVYGDSWKAVRTAEQRISLAESLFAGAEKATDDANRYVLLKTAKDQAAQAGDARLAFQAVDALAERYSVDACDFGMPGPEFH